MVGPTITVDKPKQGQIITLIIIYFHFGSTFHVNEANNDQI